MPTGLPSPTPSSYESQEIADNHAFTFPPSTLEPSPISSLPSRKWRLSDADANTSHAVKRPCTLSLWPRPQAVSDPLPTSSVLPGSFAIDDWFQDNFGIPSPVSIEEPDALVPVEVKFFDYSTISCGVEQNTLDFPARPVEQIAELHDQDLVVQPVVVPQVSMQIPHTLDVSTNDFNYDDLFYDFEESTTEAGLSLLKPHAIPPSPDVGLNAVDPNALPSTLFPKAIVDTPAIATFSPPFSQDPASDLDWVFPPITSPQDLLGPLDELESSGLNMFADSCFMFDPPVVSIRQSLLPLPTSVDKAAKQRRLLEMKEATRLLEAEIAAS